VILQAKALGLGELDQFPFLDPPRPESIRDGYRTLFELGAIDERQELTPLGRSLARLPVDPRLGRIILAGDDEGCLHEVLIIAAALAVQDPRQRPPDERQAADEAHARWADEQSDFLAYLKLWDFFHEAKRQLSRSKLERACRQQFLSYNRLREWLEVHRQLLQIVATYGLKVGPRRNQYDPIHRALLAGFLSSVAWRSDRHQYTVAGGLKAQLWPGSAAFEKRPKWVVAGEVVETTRRYLRTVARISPRWIEELAPHLVEHEYGEPHWDPTVGSAMVFEDVTLFGLPVVRQRRTRLAPIDPPLARELLINQGLVRGGYETRARFLEHNRQLLADLEDLQRRSRRHDLLRSSDARHAFYDSRLPGEVCDGPSFERWRRAAEQRDRHVLFMNESDLLVEPRVPVDRSQFPDRITIERFDLPLEYRFAPGAEADGVTIVVPQEAFNRLDPIQLEWLVPGHLEEKVTGLIRALPKSIRTHFVPIPETARTVTEQLTFGAGSLPAAVGRALAVLSGEAVPLDAFRPQRVPEHLKMRVKVIDSAGRTLATGRDLREVRGQLQTESLDFAGLAHPEWRREGLTSWEFPDLPDEIEIRRPGIRGVGYPAVVDRRQSVALELRSSRAEALEQTRAGLRRLFVLASEEELMAQVDWLPDLERILLEGSPIAGPGELKHHLAELIADRAFLADERLPRTAEEFARRLGESSERTGLAVQDVLPLASPLFEGFHQARLALEGATNWQWRYAVVDVRSQLEVLFPPDFLTSTPWRWLTQYPRYLRAIVERFEKLGSGGFARDQQAFALVGPRWDAWRELARQQASAGIYDVELVHYRWLVEEFRVSLFAQQLGTAVPVSDKRLDEQWAKVGKF
jgi:ATP-dependent helicase HrpA